MKKLPKFGEVNESYQNTNESVDIRPKVSFTSNWAADNIIDAAAFFIGQKEAVESPSSIADLKNEIKKELGLDVNLTNIKWYIHGEIDGGDMGTQIICCVPIEDVDPSMVDEENWSSDFQFAIRNSSDLGWLPIQPNTPYALFIATQ